MVDIAKEKMNKLGNTGREITQNRHKKDVGSEHQWSVEQLQTP